MIGLVKYELYKLKENRSARRVLGLLFLLQLFFLTLQAASQQQRIPARIYKDVYAELKCVETDGIPEYLSEKKQRYAPEELGYFDKRYLMYYEAAANAQQVLGYSDFLEKIFDAEESYGSVSLFAKKNAYLEKNIKKTASAYRKMEGTALPVEGSEGVLGVLVSDSILLLLLSAIYASAVFLFQLDRNTGIELMERTTVRGRRDQMAAKVIAMGIAALALLIIFTALNVVVYGVSYGFGSLLRPIQSVKGFLGCPLKESVLGYFVLSMGTRWFALFLMGLIFAFICLKTQKTGVSFFISSVIVAVMAGCFYRINDASLFVYLKYVNWFTLLESNALYGDYRNLNIFGQPVDAVGFTWLISVLLCIFLTAYVVVNGRKRKARSRRKKRVRKVYFNPIPNMFCQVAYKMLVYGRGIYILLIGAAVVLGAYGKYPVYLSQEEAQYRAYMHLFEGPFSQEKRDLAASEEKRFADLRQSLLTLAGEYAAGSIDQQTYELRQKSINQELLLEKAFERVKNNLERISSIDHGENIYEKGYEILMSEKSLLHLISYFVIGVLLLSVIVENVIQEKLSGMQDITYSTVNGRGVLKRQELIIYELCGLLICIIVFGGEILFAARNYGLPRPGAGAASLVCMQGSGGFSIGFCMFLFYIKKILIVELLIALPALGKKKRDIRHILRRDRR